MTLDEFLDDYVPRVLKPMGGWEVHPNANGAVRRGECCPLTAESQWSSIHASLCGMRMGLRSQDRSAIMHASDSDVARLHGYDPEYHASIRARLLAGLGLSEPAGERGSR